MYFPMLWILLFVVCGFLNLDKLSHCIYGLPYYHTTVLKTYWDKHIINSFSILKRFFLSKICISLQKRGAVKSTFQYCVLLISIESNGEFSSNHWFSCQVDKKWMKYITYLALLGFLPFHSDRKLSETHQQYKPGDSFWASSSGPSLNVGKWSNACAPFQNRCFSHNLKVVDKMTQ